MDFNRLNYLCRGIQAAAHEEKHPKVAGLILMVIGFFFVPMLIGIPMMLYGFYKLLKGFTCSPDKSCRPRDGGSCGQSGQESA